MIVDVSHIRDFADRTMCSWATYKIPVALFNDSVDKDGWDILQPNTFSDDGVSSANPKVNDFWFPAVVRNI